MELFTYALAIWIIAYLIGSIPFGLILTKLFTSDDLRKIGSGNIGATNVLRTGKASLAFFTLMLDGFKGALALLIIISFSDYLGSAFPSCSKSVSLNEFGQKVLSSPDPCSTIEYNSFAKSISDQTIGLLPALTILFPILGHCFPIWLKFKGGKGVATTFGVFLAAVPWAGFVAACTWGIVAGFFRYSSLSALCAVAIAPLATLFIYGPLPAAITVLIALLVFWRHKDNIKRLMDGSEPKIGEKKKEQDEPAAKS